MPSSKKTVTSENRQESNPWAPAQSGLRDVLTKAEQYGNQPDLFRATFGQEGLDALQRMGARVDNQAGQGAAGIVNQSIGPGFQTGFGALSDTASGQYLTPDTNPYLGGLVHDVTNQVNQQFSGAGRYGSGAHTNSLARGVGHVLGDHYSQERARQLNAADALYGGGFQGIGAVPAANAAEMSDVDLLAQIDQINQQNAQAPLRATEWQSGLTTPIASLGGTREGTNTTTQDNGRNLFGQILGGAQMLGGLAAGPLGSMAGRGFASLLGGGTTSGWEPTITRFS